MKIPYLFALLGIAIALIAQPRCDVPLEDTLKYDSDGALSYSTHSGYRKLPRGYNRMAWYDDVIHEC